MSVSGWFSRAARVSPLYVLLSRWRGAMFTSLMLQQAIRSFEDFLGTGIARIFVLLAGIRTFLGLTVTSKVTVGVDAR
jgi:hypothetical protein